MKKLLESADIQTLVGRNLQITNCFLVAWEIPEKMRESFATPGEGTPTAGAQSNTLGTHHIEIIMKDGSEEYCWLVSFNKLSLNMWLGSLNDDSLDYDFIMSMAQ